VILIANKKVIKKVSQPYRPPQPITVIALLFFIKINITISVKVGYIQTSVALDGNPQPNYQWFNRLVLFTHGCMDHHQVVCK
jgi:hypothetical protein